MEPQGQLAHEKKTRQKRCDARSEMSPTTKQQTGRLQQTNNYIVPTRILQLTDDQVGKYRTPFPTTEKSQEKKQKENLILE